MFMVLFEQIKKLSIVLEATWLQYDFMHKLYYENMIWKYKSETF